VAPDLLQHILDAARSLNPGDALSPEVLRAIARHAGDHGFARSAETGAGGSTLLLSNLSRAHTVFAAENSTNTLARVRASPLFRADRTTIVEGPTQRTLPAHALDGAMEAVLLDGPHAFPFPQLEYYYFYPRLGPGALLIVDDIHIPSVHDLFRFLKRDDMFELEECVGTAAFFRRTGAPLFDPYGDGWERQGYNRRPLRRYGWARAARQLLSRGFPRSSQGRVEIAEPAPDAEVSGEANVRGRVRLPEGALLWLLVRRADLDGWWPQGRASIQDGLWELRCRFGEPRDAGYWFEIAAVLVDEGMDKRLREDPPPAAMPRHWPRNPPLIRRVQLTGPESETGRLDLRGVGK
jgi:hypothetical protein